MSLQTATVTFHMFSHISYVFYLWFKSTLGSSKSLHNSCIQVVVYR